MQEIGKSNKIKIILIIITLISFILFDIFYNNKEANSEKVSNKSISKQVSKKKNKTPTNTIFLKATEEPKSNISKDEYLTIMLIENFIKAEIYAIDVDTSILSTLIDSNSEYGKSKIKEVNDLKAKGLKEEFKSLSYVKSENNGNIKVYVKINIGFKSNPENDFIFKEYKKFYEMNQKTGNDYIFVNEGSW
jgi:hypothetical protein